MGQIMKNFAFSIGLRNILMNKGVYSVYPCGYGVQFPMLLIETGESCDYVVEYVTRKKIPVCIFRRYIYINELGSETVNKVVTNNDLIGVYNYPYYVGLNIDIIKIEDVIEGYIDGFGLWSPSEIKIVRKCNYKCWDKVSNIDIEKYCAEHQEVEKYALELEKIFSRCVDNCVYGQWPQNSPYNDKYHCQREGDRNLILKKLRKFK